MFTKQLISIAYFKKDIHAPPRLFKPPRCTPFIAFDNVVAMMPSTIGTATHNNIKANTFAIVGEEPKCGAR